MTPGNEGWGGVGVEGKKNWDSKKRKEGRKKTEKGVDDDNMKMMVRRGICDGEL